MGDFTADGVLVFLGNGGLVLSGGVGLRLF